MKTMVVWAALAVIALTGAASPAVAAVYVCDDENCGSWKAITDAQWDAQSTDDDKTSVRSTLSNSSDASINNGYNSISDTDLYIKKFWHKGGKLPFDGTYQHITVAVWKGSQYKKTCHAYSFTTKLNGPYQASCL